MIVILVVEDDSDLREMTATCLRGFGYDVVTAADGVEAMERLEHRPVDLVLADWVMPRMDGLELCRLVAWHWSGRIPVLLMSGEPSWNFGSLVYAGRGAGFLRKPFDVDELKERIDALLEPE